MHPCICSLSCLSKTRDPPGFRFIVIFCRMLLFFARMSETTEYQLRRYRFVTKLLLKNMIRLHSTRLLTCSFIRSMSYLPSYPPTIPCASSSSSFSKHSPLLGYRSFFFFILHFHSTFFCYLFRALQSTK